MNASTDTLRRHVLGVEDYHHMADTGVLAPDARVELIDTEIYDMPPIGPEHAGIVNLLNRRLVLALGERALVTAHNPVVLGDCSEPQTDLVIERARIDDHRGGHPQIEDVLLLIEFADASMVHDRRRKLSLYARHGVPMFWLLDTRDASLAQSLIDTKTPVPLPGFDDINVDLSGLV